MMSFIKITPQKASAGISHKTRAAWPYLGDVFYIFLFQMGKYLTNWVNTYRGNILPHIKLFSQTYEQR